MPVRILGVIPNKKTPKEPRKKIPEKILWLISGGIAEGTLGRFVEESREDFVN